MAIDYERMQRTGRKHKSALARAVNTGDPGRVEAACLAAVLEWEAIGCWPDDWSRWQRALDDVRPRFGIGPRLEGLVAPVFAAGLSADEALRLLAAGTLDVAGVRTLGALRGGRLSTPA